jgi:hypothetical protein
LTVIQTRYTPPRFGLGTEFAESEIPIEYSFRFQNRFININGDAEKRQGLAQFGDTISGLPTITGLHEHIDSSGFTTLLASANGTIWSLNEETGVWTQVLTGKNTSYRLNSVQMTDKLIFTNGIDRNFYTDNGGDSFNEMRALIVRGVGSSTSTSAGGLSDSNITNWRTSTFVNANDLLYNSTKDAYAIITSVGSTNIQHTIIGSAATGLGHPEAASQVSANQQSGDFYQITDLVELNIIPQNNGLDNFATLTGSTSAAGIYVSGVDWTQTDIRAGDYIYNTTRSAITQVSAVTTACLTVKSVAAQAANDTIQLFKSAMPIASWAHVHYGRAYYIDARDNASVRITGPNDPQDLTTFQRTLQANTQEYSTRQPQAERLLSLKTFQKYLVAAGERNVYADNGIDPIQDTSAVTTDFSPVGLFPQGSVSRYGLESIGGAMNFIANDGLRNFAVGFDANAFQTANASEFIKSEFAQQVASKATDPDEIQTIHYPRRNWLMCKIGDVIYNYNYTPFYQNGQIISRNYGSWSKFTGLLAEQKVFFVRKNGDLLCAGPGGKVYKFDQGSYDDDGSPITTILETGWLSLNEPQQSTQLRSGTYIKPKFEAGAPIVYTISVVGDFSQISSDTVTVTAEGVGQVGFAQIGVSQVGGMRILEKKVPLRWKGEQFKIRIETNDSNGPDIITGMTVYGNILGKV